ncbi:MAG: hypothetical protein LBI74_05855, partial [Synergistaceae bacterium]|nr:hypothetical protein [Synergistaceae bacterium]
SHHPETGHSGGGSCNLGANFHHYDSNDYGQRNNIWCGNGSNHQLGQRHWGDTINANLPVDSSFVGGFCVKSEVGDGQVLDIQYKDLVQHDKIWLRDQNSGIYYPIDQQPSETSIFVEDNGWADSNRASGQVEADVLLSAKNSGSDPEGDSGDSSGGGCDAGFGFIPLAGLGMLWLRRR